MGDDGGEEDEEEDYDPADDSDYDAPKRSSKKASASKKKQKQKQQQGGADEDDAHDVAAQCSKQEKHDKAAATVLRSIKNSLCSQMVYRKGLKYFTSRLSLELPCLSEGVVAAMLGPALMAKATNGKKQLQLKASLEDVEGLFGWRAFSKSLRYGATLGLVAGLTFTFNKGTSVLKVHGSYTMHA